MRVILNKPWQLHQAGDVLELTKPIGEVLIQSGRAKMSIVRKNSKKKGETQNESKRNS